MNYELKDWLNSINQTKKNIMDEDLSSIKEYSPYIINKCMSGHIDCIMLSNEMNKNSFLDKKLQYDFFINIVRTKKRFSPWIRKDKIRDIDIIKKYFGYSDQKAEDALRILSEEQINYIRQKIETGGKK
jgi:hypothetical protein